MSNIYDPPLPTSHVPAGVQAKSIKDATTEWTQGEQRAYDKYGLGGGGWPGGMGWYQKQSGPLPAMPSSGDIQQDRLRQSALLDYLQRRAQGQGLAAHEQGRRAIADMQAQGQSAAATGPYDPAVQRAAQYAQASAQRRMAGPIQQAALAEQLAYQQLYGQGAGQMQDQETDRWKDLAAQGLAEQGMRNVYTDLGLRQLGLDRQYDAAYDAYWRKIAQQGEAETKGNIGGVAQFGASLLAAMSDVRAKKDIAPAGPTIEEFLSALSPETYSYKPGTPAGGPGRHTGVMAQDLEQSELGRQLVQDTPSGKVVDYGRAMPALLAALVHLHQKQQAMEQRNAEPQAPAWATYPAPAGGAPYPGFDEGPGPDRPQGPAVDEMGVPLSERGAYPARVDMPPLTVEGRGPTGPGPLVDENLQLLARPEERVKLRVPWARR